MRLNKTNFVNYKTICYNYLGYFIIKERVKDKINKRNMYSLLLHGINSPIRLLNTEITNALEFIFPIA